MMHFMKGLAGLGAVVLVSACATTLEPDGRLDSARGLVEEAADYGTRTEAYTFANTYLGEAETAFADGDAADYDRSVLLSEAYARLAIAEGQGAEAQSTAGELRSSLETAEAGLLQCEGTLAECQAAAADRSAALADMVSMLAAAMECTSTDMGEGVKLACPGLGFGFESSALQAVTDARLAALAEFLRQNPAATVDLVGHTDSTGSEAYNQALSERRARTVAEALQAAGIDAGRMTMSGAGESEPVADNGTRAGRMENRRVDVMINGLMMATMSEI